jgi:N-acetylmuramoyl-L-alanine amidase
MAHITPKSCPRIASAVLVALAIGATACSSGTPVAKDRSPMATSTKPPAALTGPTRMPTVAATPPPATLSPVSSHPSVVPKASPTSTAPPSTSAGTVKPLAGKVIAVDPGHNGGNAAAPGVINQIIWNGRENETCDTTGTATDSGYSEAQFNYNVARYLTADLQAEGATVVLTRQSNTGVGPCVAERAAIGNNAHADAAISIHADGGPEAGRGFAILEPVADGPNDAIIARSQTLGLDIRTAFLAGTGEPVSTYDGVNGLQPRDDLAGLNLSTVPKVLIECANMRNPTDAALLTTAQWQQIAAKALAAGLTVFLTS